MKRPLVAVTLAYLGGLFLGHLLDLSWTSLLVGAGFLILLTLLLLWRQQPASVYPLLAAALCGGALLYEWDTLRPQREPLRSFFGQGEVQVLGTVVEEPRHTQNRWRLRVAVQQVRRPSGALKPVNLDAAEERPAWLKTPRSRLHLVTAERPGIDYGDQVEFVGELEAPRPATNPGQFSLRTNLARQGLYASAFLTEDHPLKPGGPGRVRWSGRAAVSLRQALTGTIERTMPRPYPTLYAQLFNSIVYGLYAVPIPEDLEELFRRAGVIHILVASGTQVSLLVLFLLWPLRRRRPPVPVAILIGLVVVAYSAVARPEASIVRAAAIGLLVVLALVLNREPDALTLLALAALAVLVPHPQALFASANFQLSFAAVLGLMYLGSPLQARLSRWLPNWIALPMSMSVGAQLAVAPILVHGFQRFSLAAFVANVPIVPLAGLLVASGLITSVLGLLYLPLAAGLNVFNHLALTLLLKMTAFFAHIPYGYVDLPAISAWHIGLWYVGLGLLALALTGRLRTHLTRENLLVGTLLVVTVLVVWKAIASANATLRVTFLDVGNGDAILIQSPSGRTMLIDGGPRQEEPYEYDAGERVVVPALMALGVRALDVVVLTHPENDHVGGLTAVLKAVPVRHVLEPGVEHEARSYQEFRHEVQKQGLPRLTAARGQRINLGRGVRVYVLWPLAPSLRPEQAKVNNQSVVLKLVYGRISFLFTGDIEAEVEEELLRQGGHLRSTVLKVAHHGSGSSTTEPFRQAVQPEVAVISVGRANPHGHPSPEVYQRLKDNGAKVYRTDWSGAITIKTNGRGFKVEEYGEK